ncbi:MAG: M48 family metallopeptidase [Schleiferiaceae bacterium]|nr:M48 family metallopeptidase [Schleiferiaceae bacterium]
MAKYIGIQEQIRRNNRKSVFLLMGFPVLMIGFVYVIAWIFHQREPENNVPTTLHDTFFSIAPYVLGVVAIWFLVAYFGHSKMINSATHAQPLERKSNMRIYNLVENLCMSIGMPMPKVQIIEDSGLNAFASGLNEKTFAVTLTRGLIEKLDDDELEGVIAHELMHIQNRDVRLLVISIIFVGIFSVLVQVLFRSLFHASMFRGRKKDDKGATTMILIVLLLAAAVAYFLSYVFKFALSRKREYMADAGAAEMTKKPGALANALRKISGNSAISNLNTTEVKELFIDNYPEKEKSFFSAFSGLFATHPPIAKRITALENY